MTGCCVFGAGPGAEVSLKDFRKDIILELYNEAGQLVVAYKIYRCWVSEYQILPDLDANANAIAIEQIKLEMKAGNATILCRNPSSHPQRNRSGHGSCHAKRTDDRKTICEICVIGG